MSIPDEEDFITRRTKLAGEISRQRCELLQAYAQLEKPIRYTENGMKVFAFLRQNPWVVAAVPAGFSLISNIVNWRKPKATPVKTGYAPAPATPARKLSRVGQAAMTGAEQAIRLYNLYRRVRSLIP